MEKEKLKEKINQIPKFRLRNVAVSKDEDLSYDSNGDEVEWFQQEYTYAVTEVDRFKALTFVGPKYNLIQFSDVFMPIVDSMDDIEGELIYDEGYSYLYVFPKEDKYKEGADEFGLAIVNSVNRTASVMIKFIVKHNGKKILLPEKISGFKRNHKGKSILSMTKDYLYMIDNVKDMWKRIIQTFGKEKLTEEYISGIGFDKNVSKALKKKLADCPVDKELTLWDAFMYALEYIGSKEYKTAVHKRKKLDKVCETIIEYAIMMGI